MKRRLLMLSVHTNVPFGCFSAKHGIFAVGVNRPLAYSNTPTGAVSLPLRFFVSLTVHQKFRRTQKCIPL